MMKKIYIFVFLFLISFQSEVFAYDCNFEKIKPGVTKKELEKINIFAYGSTDSDILIRQIYAEKLCKGGDLKDIFNVNVFLVFYKEKLIKVNYINKVVENQILFQIAKKDYKIDLERNKASIKKKQAELYSSTLNGNSYFYVLLKNRNPYEEYLEIVSDKDISKFEEFLLKIEEAR